MNRYRYNSSSNCNQKKDFKKPEGSYQDNYQWSNSNQSNYQSQSNSNWFQQSSRRQSYNQQTFSYFNTSSAELYRDRDYPTSSSGDFVEQGYQVFNSFPTPPSIQKPSTNNFRTYNVKQNQLYNCEQSHDSNSYSTELIPRRQLKRAYDSQSPVRMSKMPRNNIQSQETGITNHNLVVCGGESSTSRPAEQQRQPYQKNQRITRNRPSRQKPANKPANFNNNWHDAIEYVMKKLKMRASNNVEDCFESEVNLLTCCLQNSAQQSQATKSEVDNDLRNLVRPLGVKNVLAFGSKLTGLEFLQSDIDYHVELEQPPKSNEEAKPIIDMVGSLTRASKSGQRPPFFVKCSILGARVPLIRLVHRRHMITCDVNFTSKNGYYNSQYIKQVLSFDTRIKDVAIILKLWSKINHLNGKMVMSSYCLVNLLFFFLQNLITPMLGNLKDVQKDKIDDESNSNWNFYYDDTMNKCQDNTQSTRELVEEFFEFYNKINFVNYVICLYSGQLVRRDEFDENEDLDHYRNTIAEHRMPPFKLKEEDSIMVQDPFEQNINIGIKGKKRIEIFTACMADAYRKCKEFKHENFSKLLFELFTEHVIVEKKPAKMEKKDKKLFQLTVHSTAGDLKMCQDVLVDSDPSKVFSDDDSAQFFYDHLVESTSKLLTEIYLCDVITVESKNEETCKSIVLNVKLQYDTFKDRKKLNFKSQFSYEGEISVSNMLFEKKESVDLDILVTMSTKDSCKTVDFKMVNREPNPKSMILNFGNFISVNITSAMRYYLKQKWDSRHIA